MKSGSSLTDFALKRARLAGWSILEHGNPWFTPLDRLKQDVEARGRELVSFANYDYLGLADHPAIRTAAQAALERFGTGALGSRLVGGERTIHKEFEEEVARFVGTESCLALVSGYLTNNSIIQHLLGSKDLLIVDELSHNSIMMGAKAAKAELLVFRHNDLDHLDELLTAHRAAKRNCLIAVESLYSMDGDMVELPKLLEIKDKHKAWLLVDEAHSFGVLGDSGRGISEHYGTDPNRIDLIVGTMSKSLVSSGGFLCARTPIIEWLRYTLPGFVYSVGLSPVVVATAHAALGLIIGQPQRTARLRLISELFLTKAQAAGLSTGHAIGRGIVPVMFEDLETTMRVSQTLVEAGVYAPPVVHVGVPKDAPRIRFFISAAHEPHELDRAVTVMRDALRRPNPDALSIAL